MAYLHDQEKKLKEELARVNSKYSPFFLMISCLMRKEMFMKIGLFQMSFPQVYEAIYDDVLL